MSLLFTFSLLLLTSTARAATIEIRQANIAAMTEEGKKDVTVGGCVPGFFTIGVKETSDVKPSDHGIVVPGPVRIVPVR